MKSPQVHAIAPWRYRIGFWSLVVLLVTLPGCGGCLKSPSPPTTSPTAEEEEAKRREEERRRRELANQPLNLGELRIQPHDRQATMRGVKPGHWTAALQAARANQADVQAQLTSFPVTSDGVPQQVDYTPYRLLTARPAALPKGQTRYFETLHRIPADEATSSARLAALERVLVPRSGARDELRDRQPVTLMPGHEYYLVVLAETPDEYAFYRRLHSVALPPVFYDDGETQRHFRVVIPERTTGIPPLPTHPLAWTSIAHLVWDNFQPNLLSPLQQTALLDWLHWGGQLVISGPGSMEKLTGSFLEPYLPADRVATVERNGEDFVDLNQAWSLVERKTGVRRDLEVDDAAPVVGVSWQLRKDAREVEGTGGLLAERRVGAGRVVLTSFGLTDRAILNWGCYDSFVNGALLRRPSRQFVMAGEFEEIQCHWVDFPWIHTDARLNSGLRYFSRDAARPPVQGSERGRPGDGEGQGRGEGNADAKREGEGEGVDEDEDEEDRYRVPEKLTEAWRDRRIEGVAASSRSGVGAWNDFSDVSTAARDTLREAAGISIPSASFVLNVVVVYLLVLTPLNWGFFRLLGRVEWAWLAAPGIAVIGAIVVVRMAQLDIGFVRSQTEIATLEVQADYPRAHLTRYTALYSSLSTRYEVVHEDGSALMQPFSTGQHYRQGGHEATTQLTLHRGRDVRLSGLTVTSNSTSMLRSEQMVDLGGPFRLVGDEESGWEIENLSDVGIRDAGVLYRDDDGELTTSWLGDVLPKSRRRFFLVSSRSDRSPWEPWGSVPVFQMSEMMEGGPRLGRLFRFAAREWPLGFGEMRLIGWTGEEWPGQTVTPESNQRQQATLIVVHLRHSNWKPARRDQNLLADLVDSTRWMSSPRFDDLDDFLDDDNAGEWPR
jgi:hypothetical protein